MSKERKSSARLNYEANCNVKRFNLFCGLGVGSAISSVLAFGFTSSSVGLSLLLGTSASVVGMEISNGVANNKEKRGTEYSQDRSTPEVSEGHIFTRRKLYRPIKEDLFGKGTVNN